MPSPQTLSLVERRLLAAWAADCAQRVLAVFEAAAPDDHRPRESLARTRAFARGELDVAGEIRHRFRGADAAREVKVPAAAAAARAVGQAAGVAHMGAHALGAAAYAAHATGLSTPQQPDAASREIDWQLTHATEPVKTALRKLPPLGENPSGPLGRGLLASGALATIIRELQSTLNEDA